MQQMQHMRKQMQLLGEGAKRSQNYAEQYELASVSTQAIHLLDHLTTWVPRSLP